MSRSTVRIEILENRRLLSVAAAVGGIAGLVFNDHNASGTQDTGDAGLANVRVFLDLKQTGIYATRDPSVATNAKGTYTFANLKPGNYAVATQPPAGYQQDFPFAGPDIHLVIAAGKTSAGINFAETTGSHVSGTVYSNASGKSVGMAGVSVTITAANGKGPAYTRVTDSIGYYGVGGLPNTSYKVTLKLPPAYLLAGGNLSQTTPVLKSGQNDNAVNFTLTPAIVFNASTRFVDLQAGTGSKHQAASGNSPFNASITGEDNSTFAGGNYIDLSGSAAQSSTLTPTEITDGASSTPANFAAVYALEQDSLGYADGASAQAKSYFKTTFTVKSAETYSLNVATLEAFGPYAETFSFTGPGGAAIAPTQAGNGDHQSGTLKPGTYTIAYDLVCYDNDDNLPQVQSYGLDLKFGV